MLIGDDGETNFMNEFPRIAEGGASPAVEVIQFQDFDGFVGGSVDLVGFGLLATEIVRGTIPVIEAGEIIVWNQSNGFVSAGNTGAATRTVVNVPEPASLSFSSLFSALLICVGVLFKMR